MDVMIPTAFMFWFLRQWGQTVSPLSKYLWQYLHLWTSNFSSIMLLISFLASSFTSFNLFSDCSFTAAASFLISLTFLLTLLLAFATFTSVSISAFLTFTAAFLLAVFAFFATVFLVFSASFLICSATLAVFFFQVFYFFSACFFCWLCTFLNFFIHNSTSYLISIII